MKRKAGTAKRLRNLVQGLPRFAGTKPEAVATGSTLNREIVPVFSSSQMVLAKGNPVANAPGSVPAYCTKTMPPG